MEKPLISIILTCYNRETYVVEALDSIKRQSYENFECLVIDDGSTDSSRSRIQEAVGDDARFKLHFIDHVGFPSAKNFGLDHVIGDYVIFLDSDDIAHPNWLGLLVYTAQITKAPIVVCNFKLFSDSKKIKMWSLSSDTPLHISEYSFLRMNLVYNVRVMHFMWNKLIRSDLYKGVRHKEQMALSDVDVMGDIFFKVNYVVELGLPLVYYRQHPGSMGNITRGKGVEYWAWRFRFQKEKIRIDWERAPQSRYAYQQALIKMIQDAREGLKDQFDEYCDLSDVQDMLAARVPKIIEP